MDRPVKIVTIISGSGSDNESVLKAHAAGLIPNAEIVSIIGTAPGLEGFERAEKLGYGNNLIVADYGKYKDRSSQKFYLSFEDEIAYLVNSMNADLFFALGCKYRLPIIPGIMMLNIHPQDTDKHGGHNMVGLGPHKNFLVHEVGDLIHRGRKKITDPFHVVITIHEISENWDEGRVFLQYKVRIPEKIIADYITKKNPLEEAAEKVQKFVLKHEHRLLPHAVNLAVQEIQDSKAV